jgi:hydrogenase expression/formation protein HypE
MSENVFPLGKLPMEVLAAMLSKAPVTDPRVLLGPGIGLDCGIIEIDGHLLVLKTEPITFATDEIGWYGIQVSANDIATTGAVPRWYLVTLLLPENKTTPSLVERISTQIYDACRQMDISVLGGHTEITHGLDRPILVGTLIGEVTRENLVTQRDSRPGDRILLTKGIPIEGTALLAREFSAELNAVLTPDELTEAADFLYHPGISVVPDAQTAIRAGRVTAMHDPTEGGVAAALWEMAISSSATFQIDSRRIMIPPLSAKICRHFHLDPLATIASGALLLTVAAQDAGAICAALQAQAIACTEIGQVAAGAAEVWDSSQGTLLPRPARDDITRVYEKPAA